MKGEPITGVILSGGQGSRLGYVDKGLLEFRGRPMVAQVIARFAPQVDELLISANRNLDQYAQFGFGVVEDSRPHFAGPLAGVESALQAARYEWLATVPCDSPLLPLDLVQRLRAAMTDDNVDVCVARSEGRTHPVFSLIRKRVLANLTDYLASGGRKYKQWTSNLRVVEVSFDDEANGFKNLNTQADIDAAKGLSR